MSLYLKYRPQTIEELDLPHVREFLHGLVKSQRVAHAYLFEGPRGAGKTSTGRILAKMLNCLGCQKQVCKPCGQCQACLSIQEGSATDVIEIDGASNRRIDDIRDLKQKIGLMPTILRKKIYIIDEVHMLTREAFNALLKTLEEPPSHVVFVLATTEVEKVPETIVSRCVRVSFRKAKPEELKRALQRVIEGEGVAVEEGSLELIARGVDGSFRDGVKVLEQAMSEAGGGEVKKELVEKLLYGAVGFDEKQLLELIIEKETDAAIQEVRKFVEGGGDSKFLLGRMLWLLKESLLAVAGVKEHKGSKELGQKVGLEQGMQLADLLAETYLKINEGIGDAGIWLELMIVRWAGKKKDEENEEQNKNDRGERQEEKSAKKIEEIERTTDKPRNGHQSRRLERSDWQTVIKEAGKYYSLGALLSKTRLVGQKEGELVIEVEYSFHKQQLEQEKYLRKVEELVADIFGAPLRVRVQLRAKNQKGQDEDERLMKVAEEIFLGN